MEVRAVLALVGMIAATASLSGCGGRDDVAVTPSATAATVEQICQAAAEHREDYDSFVTAAADQSIDAAYTQVPVMQEAFADLAVMMSMYDDAWTPMAALGNPGSKADMSFDELGLTEDLVTIGVYLADNCPDFSDAPRIVSTPPSPAPEVPVEIASIPISDSAGYQAVVHVTSWEETTDADTSACPAIAFTEKYDVRAVVISGFIEYPEVNGLTWADPINLFGTIFGASKVTSPDDPVVGAVCARPASAPNSASELPSLRDDVFVVPPDRTFDFTFVYGSATSPDSPDGRWAESGPLTQSLHLPSVNADCTVPPVPGLTSSNEGGYCFLTRVETD